jgi:hypothetical protein
MNAFFWTSGHLGWGMFTLVAFTFLWVIVSDLIWRLINLRFIRLAFSMSVGWLIGAGLILLGFYLGNR